MPLCSYRIGLDWRNLLIKNGFDPAAKRRNVIKLSYGGGVGKGGDDIWEEVDVAANYRHIREEDGGVWSFQTQLHPGGGGMHPSLGQIRHIREEDECVWSFRKRGAWPCL